MKHFALKEKVPVNGFEGWYTRITDVDHDINIAVIFAKTTYHRDPHGFIQIYDGHRKTNQYFRYQLADFKATDAGVYLKDNHLSLRQMNIHAGDYHFDIEFSKPIHNQFKSAMGFLEKLPLETFQEVVLMEAQFSGRVVISQQETEVQGKAYMEKTYGKKFPKTWFWLQANHFLTRGLALSMSGGHVPTLFFRPFGFFVLISTPQKVYRFATYNLARCQSYEDDAKVIFDIKRGAYHLHLEVTDHQPIALVGPQDHGEMNLPVDECINAKVKLILKKFNRIILEDSSSYAGFEWMMKGAV